MTENLVPLVTGLLQEMLEADGRASDGLTPEIRLFGKEGLLDSMGLVSLVVSVEQAIEDRYGVSVALADERALSRRASPYRTIASLADYASAVLEEDR